VAGGRCQPTTSGMLQLLTQTRSSGERCRGPRRASPREESTAREREKKGGPGGDVVAPFYRGAWQSGSWGSSGEWCHAVGGREGGPDGAWREGGSGGHGARAAEPGHGRVTLQCRTGERGRQHVGPRPQYRVTRLNLIQFQISNGFKFFQAFTDPKMTFPSSKKFKQNMVMKDLKKGTTFSIGTSSDSK
jgi:hypothetical protein